MLAVGRAIDRAFDAVLAPFAGAPAWGMVIVSLITAVIVLLVFRSVTDQARLVAARNRVLGHVYEMGLFQERLSVLARIQRDLALANLRYAGRALPALLVMLIPVAAVVLQLEGRLGRRPFVAGETTLVHAELAPETAQPLASLALETGDGLELDAPPVLAPAAGTVVWRVRVQEEGRHALTVVAASGERWILPLVAGSGLPRVEVERRRESTLAAAVSGRQATLPADGALASLSLRVPAREVRYLGVAVPWLGAFLILSLVAGWLLKGPLRVRF